MVQDLLVEYLQRRTMSESKEVSQFEKAYLELIEVLNKNKVDARTAIHLAQDIITNATLALLMTPKVESSKES